MIFFFTLLILFVSMLAAIPLALDPELRQNVTFRCIPVVSGLAIYLLLWA